MNTLENDTETDATGARVWEQLYEVFRSSKPYMDSVAGTFDLTVQQLIALKNLSDERSMTMSELAGTLGCDASNVTSIVDKLESRGFVERRSAGHDRRVKALRVTSAGVELRHQIHARMRVPPPAIANLTRADLAALGAILQRALDSLSAEAREISAER